MTDKAKLLGRVRMYDFALVEVIEYLDGHPDNAAALKYYNEMRTAFDKAAAEYEDAFGPLTAREVDKLWDIVRKLKAKGIPAADTGRGSTIRGRGKELRTNVVI